MKKLLNLLMVIVAMASVSFVSTGCSNDDNEIEEANPYKKILTGYWINEGSFKAGNYNGTPSLQLNSDGTFRANAYNIVLLYEGTWSISDNLMLTVKSSKPGDHTMYTREVTLVETDTYYRIYIKGCPNLLYKIK